MKKVQVEDMFPWELTRAMAQTPLCYLPLGVIEWHGEHSAVGLDAIKVHALCVQAARLSGGVVVPPVYWATDYREGLDDGTYLTGGIEMGERYHVPGNMFWLRPETYRNLLLDMYEAMRRRGYRAIVVVTGHWHERVHLPTIRATGAQFLAEHPNMKWLLLTDQDVVPDLHYPREHAAGGETSLLMAVRPDLVDLSKTFATDTSLRDCYAGQPAHLQRRRETSHKYIGVFTAVDDASNDPESTASVERGELLFRTISERIAARAEALVAAPTVP